MHHQLVMITARDLAWDSSGNVIVGAETDRVCRAAVRRFNKLEKAGIIVTAGYSKKYHVTMGHVTMRDHLIDAYAVPGWRIHAPEAQVFDTNGEMRSLARYMREALHNRPEDTFELHLAASWWHWPRAYALLRARLEPWQRRQTTIHPVLAWSQPTAPYRDWFKAFLGEILLAGFVINIVKGNLFRKKHDLYTCVSCGAMDCVEICKNGDTHCHRCGVLRPLCK